MDKNQFRPNFFFLAAILAVVFLAYYARKTNTEPMTFKISTEGPKTSTASFKSNDSSEGAGAESIDQDMPLNSASGVSQNPKDPLEAWVQEEAKALNSVSVNTLEREKYISEKVKSFGDQQLLKIQKIAMNQQVSQNERILSVYMIGQSGAGREMLKNIASQPTSETTFEPHTESEIKSTSDRAARIMAIDAIFNSPSPKEERRIDLQEIISRTNDDLVKNYALSKLKVLQ